MRLKEAEDADARGRIAPFEKKANEHSHIIAILQDKVTQLSTDFGGFVGEVSALRSASAGIERLW
jgi:DNA helicase TIP49 (TBP-interacting protein)